MGQARLGKQLTDHGRALFTGGYWKGEFPWREAGPPNHHDDKVDSDQYVVNKELALLLSGGLGWRASWRSTVGTTASVSDWRMSDWIRSDWLMTH